MTLVTDDSAPPDAAPPSDSPDREPVRVLGLPVDRMADNQWRDVAALLRPAVEASAGRMTMDRLRDQLDDKNFQLWVAWRGKELIGAWISTLTVLCDGETKVCELLYCGGNNIQTWLDLGLDIVERWARSKGCGSITIVGRLGWGRITRHRGYEHFVTVLEKEIDHG